MLLKIPVRQGSHIDSARHLFRQLTVIPLELCLALVVNKIPQFYYVGGRMTPDEQEEMNLLCQRIIEEQDHGKFMDLVRQLNQLLEHKRRRVERPAETPSD